MGKKLDSILGRSFKPYKFKALINLSLSRLAVLKNQKHARYSLSRSDVVQLLSLGHHERALIRVEQVIKEQNMLDVFGMIEGYCVVLSERINVIQNEKECPNELREAISGLVFASARCGEFPELQQIRRVFTSRYGKEFIACAVELRNHCGVNPKMIQMLSTRQPTLEDRMKVLKEMAEENGIALQLQEAEAPPTVTQEQLNEEDTNQPTENQACSSKKSELEQTVEVEGYRNSMNNRKQYKDVADAAHEAFMSAAYAAAAARAAVELSRSTPRPPPDSSNDRRNKILNNSEINQVSHSRVSKNKFNINSGESTKMSELESLSLTRESSTILFAEDKGKGKDTGNEVVYDDSDCEDEDRNKYSNGGTELPYYFSGENMPYSFGSESVTDKKSYFSAGKMWLNTANRPVSMRMRR